MTFRDTLAAEMYRFYSNGCLVPFQDQGEELKKLCYAEADTLIALLWKEVFGPEEPIFTRDPFFNKLTNGETPQ